MPDYSQWRVQKAEDFEDLYKELRSDDLDVDSDWLEDWSFVIGFYSALHYCNAYLESEGHPAQKFSTHTRRDDLLQDHHGPVREKYKPLYQLSHQVRYRKRRPSGQDREQFPRKLREFIQMCRRRLGLPA